MKGNRINILATVAFCIYLAAIGALCFMHGDDLPSINDTWFGIPADKAAHFIMFCPFIPLSYLMFSKSRSSISRDIILLTALMFIGGLTAYATEIIQERLGYRTYDTTDLTSDCIGLSAGCAVTIIGLIIKNFSNRH